MYSHLSANHPISTRQETGKGIWRSPISFLVEENTLVLFLSVPMAEQELKSMTDSGSADSSSLAFCFSSL
jgi:hypothetical protein